MENINLKDLFVYYIKKIYIVIIVAALVVLFGEWKLKKIVPVYESTTKFTISNVKRKPSNPKEETDLQLFENYRTLINSVDFVKPVVDSSNLKVTVDLAINNTVLIQEEGTNIFTVKYSNSDKYIAHKYNEKLTTSYIVTLKKNKITSAKIIQETSTTNDPINIDYNKKRITYLAAGIIAGCLIIFVMFYFSDTIKSSIVLEEYNLLGELSSRSFLDKLNLIKSRLLLGDKDSKVVLFTSINRCKDIDTLARSIAKETSKNSKVLFINANLRSNYTQKLGYTDLIKDYNNKTKLDEYIIKKDELDIIENGLKVNDPVSLLSNSNNAKLVESLKKEYDYIFIESADLKNKCDSLVLSKLTDKVVVLVKKNITKTKALNAANKSFEQINQTIDGVVFSSLKK